LLLSSSSSQSSPDIDVVVVEVVVVFAVAAVVVTITIATHPQQSTSTVTSIVAKHHLLQPLPWGIVCEPWWAKPLNSILEGEILSCVRVIF
jgi:hypothetical protein